MLSNLFAEKIINKMLTCTPHTLESISLILQIPKERLSNYSLLTTKDKETLYKIALYMTIF